MSPQTWTLVTDKIVKFIAIPEHPLAVEDFARPWSSVDGWRTNWPISRCCPQVSMISQIAIRQPSVLQSFTNSPTKNYLVLISYTFYTLSQNSCEMNMKVILSVYCAIGHRQNKTSAQHVTPHRQLSGCGISNHASVDKSLRPFINIIYIILQVLP